MNRYLTRCATAALLALALLAGSGNWFDRLTAPLQAQQGAQWAPGPIIEDPPGPFAGNSYVPASSKTRPTQFLSTWQVTYNGFSPQAQAAFQAAVDVWASQISSPVPIQVTANWTVLASNVLGSAGAAYITRDFSGAAQPGTWFGAAIANRQAGFDLFPANNDINANFNSNFTWYYGTDGNAGSNYDLMTVVLHELGHGLGFFGSICINQNTGSCASAPVSQAIWGSGTGFPYIYDRFAVNGSSQFLINTGIFANPSAELAAQITSANIFFDGANAKGANGGVRPKLYAPASYTPGSTYSHLDESTYTAGGINSLMTPQLGAGEAIHDTGPITRGLLTDSGWGPVTSCSYSLSAGSVAISAAGGAGSVNVIAGAGCAWTAVSNAGFVTITGGSSGSGNGTVSFTVAANSGAPRSGTLTAAGQTFTVNQATGTRRTGDFDGDRKTDVTVFRPSTGIWYVRNSSNNSTSFFQWGLNGDIPVQGDYDGDGTSDIAVFRPSTGIWYIRQSSNGASAFLQWGLDGDIPTPGDYNGDGKTDSAVFRPSTGIFYVRDLATNTALFYQWGLNGDIPVVGDYDGDGKTDVAVFRPSTGIWYVRQSTNGAGAFLQWGLTGDIPAPGDYNGDLKADAAVFRPTTGIWYVRDLATNTALFYQWGVNGDIPVPGDFDGDGKTDVAVFRPSTAIWYILNSSNGSQAFQQWGATGDIPALKLP